MSIKKSSIQQALIEAREIENSAIDKARKALEEELAPKIKQVALDALKELEQESINEDVTIKISTDGGETINTPENIEDETNITDVVNSSEENDNIDNLEEMDIFEIEGLGEAEEIAQPEVGTTPTEAPAVQDTEIASQEIAAPTAEETATIETVNQKLDDVLAKLDSISNEETIENNDTEGEGDVEIIEDQPEVIAPEVPQTATPAPAQTPSLQEEDETFEYELDEDENSDDEVVYEMEDDENSDDEVVFEYEDASETGKTGDSLDIFHENDLSEIEIVDENSDNEIEEITALNAQRSADRRQLTIKGNPLSKHAPVSQVALAESIDKIKAQYGSKNDELSKENESLKQTIKEYKESFVVIRKQINEVQIFNAKLAYANKLFTNGGLTNDEKIKIAEDFDKVHTIEEAKKLYNTFLSEMNISKSPKTTSIDKLKSASPAVVNSSNAQTLFESDEMRRMKRLAGIGKKVEE